MDESDLSAHPRRRHPMGTRRSEGGSASESQGGGSRGLHQSAVPGTAACDEPDAEVATDLSADPKARPDGLPTRMSAKHRSADSHVRESIEPRRIARGWLCAPR